jgi:hypothetical protein
VFEFGKNDSDSLIKIGMRADKLQSLHDKKEKNKDGFIIFNAKKRKNLKKKFQKIKYKIQNTASHNPHRCRSTLFLCLQYFYWDTTFIRCIQVLNGNE